ncbi:MAG: SpoIID/LytB domain-containing protein [Butyrivibrio sp.]|nr:SpoIID/LytB domain-containing protein [Butyrivibrio sp.]
MKKTFLYIIIYIAACLVVPYVITMLMTGVSGGTDEEESAKNVILNYDKATEITDVADYVTRTVAAYYKEDDSPEFLKAFSVVVRTYAEYAREDKAMLDSADLALKTLTQKDMRNLWGEDYDENYDAVRLAVNETGGEYMTCGGQTIMPYFHSVNSGRTRNGTESYLVSVDSPEDLKSADYISITEYRETELAKILKAWNGDIILDKSAAASFQIADRDEAGYVRELMVGNLTVSGSEIAVLLGLPSSDFTVSSSGDRVIFTVKGKGSGYGLSLAGAREKAAAGADYKEILNYYYKNIRLENV